MTFESQGQNLAAMKNNFRRSKGIRISWRKSCDCGVRRFFAGRPSEFQGQNLAIMERTVERFPWMGIRISKADLAMSGESEDFRRVYRHVEYQGAINTLRLAERV